MPPSASPVSPTKPITSPASDAPSLDGERRVGGEVRVVELVALRVAQPESVAADPVEADRVQRPVGDREERRTRRRRRCPRRDASLPGRSAAGRRSCRRTTLFRRWGRRSRPTRASPRPPGQPGPGRRRPRRRRRGSGARGMRSGRPSGRRGWVVVAGLGGRGGAERSATETACALPMTISLPAGRPPCVGAQSEREARVTDACAAGGPALRLPLSLERTVSVPQSSSDALPGALAMSRPRARSPCTSDAVGLRARRARARTGRDGRGDLARHDLAVEERDDDRLGERLRRGSGSRRGEDRRARAADADHRAVRRVLERLHVGRRRRRPLEVAESDACPGRES